MAAGDVERAKAGLSERMLGELAGTGAKEDVYSAVRRYQDAGVTSPGVGGAPRTDFDATVDAVAELL
jgi:hypothetical protein